MYTKLDISDIVYLQYQIIGLNKYLVYRMENLQAMLVYLAFYKQVVAELVTRLNVSTTV